MDYPWYEEIYSSGEITQGDIITECNIPLHGKKLYEALLEDKELTSPIDIKIADVIVLSQVCDIKLDKVDSIVVCPVWPLTTLIETNSYFNSSDAKESLRQGKEPPYHLLNEYTLLKFKFSVVDFHRIYSLPKDYIKNVAENIKIRLRLLPPYREHLSQAFARYFMRVGLPVDIEKDRIREVKAES